MTNKKFRNDLRTNARGMKVRMLDSAAGCRQLAAFSAIDGNESNRKRWIARSRQYLVSSKNHHQPLP